MSGLQLFRKNHQKCLKNSPQLFVKIASFGTPKSVCQKKFFKAILDFIYISLHFFMIFFNLCFLLGTHGIRSDNDLINFIEFSLNSARKIKRKVENCSAQMILKNENCSKMGPTCFLVHLAC